QGVRGHERRARSDAAPGMRSARPGLKMYAPYGVTSCRSVTQDRCQPRPTSWRPGISRAHPSSRFAGTHFCWSHTKNVVPKQSQAGATRVGGLFGRNRAGQPDSVDADDGDLVTSSVPSARDCLFLTHETRRRMSTAAIWRPISPRLRATARFGVTEVV